MTDTAAPAPPAAPAPAAPEAAPTPGAAFRDRIAGRPDIEVPAPPEPGPADPGAAAPFDEPVDPELAAASVDDPDAQVGEEFTEEEEAPSDLFGLPRDEFMTAMEGAEDGVLPDSVLESMFIKVTRDGADELMSLTEYRDGGLRQADYSRKLNTLRGEKQQFSTTQDAFAGMVNNWKAKPETMADDLELLGIDIEAVLEPVAAMYAAEADLSPRERDLARRVREAERRERMSKLRQRTEAEAISRGQESVAQTRLQKKVESYRTPAFAMAKITDGPVAQRIFHEHLSALWQAGPLTAKLTQDAAKATREDLIRMANDYRSVDAPAPPAVADPANPPPAAPGPPPARAGAAPGGGKLAAERKSGTREEFHKHIEGLRDRRR